MRKASFCAVGVLIFAPLSYVYGQGPERGVGFIDGGMPPVAIHPTVEGQKSAHVTGDSSANKNLYYHGGAVQTAPRIYLVLWGSQWSNDPSGEAGILQNFYNGVGGSPWLNSVTEYCQGVGAGSFTCGTTNTGTVGNPANMLAGFWQDQSQAPNRPNQSQLAAEAVKAALHFSNTTSASNVNAQYVIATAHGHNATGFGTQYCAWHSATNSSAGTLAYTNLPYITDAGASCGANFNGMSSTAGITIVAGHEMAETVTDPFPSSGWLDTTGAENGDKCAWISSGQGASAPITLSTGSFPVQSLWSNAFSSGAGGCVMSY